MEHPHVPRLLWFKNSVLPNLVGWRFKPDSENFEFIKMSTRILNKFSKVRQIFKRKFMQKW
jgi:hypothetical protein